MQTSDEDEISEDRHVSGLDNTQDGWVVGQYFCILT